MPEIELNINTLYVVYRERALQPVLLKAFVEAIKDDTKAFHSKMNDWQFDFENAPHTPVSATKEAQKTGPL